MKKFTYFHGTSTLFLPSIKKNGLGFINPSIDHKNIDLLKHLFNILESTKFKQNICSQYFREVTLAMIKQTSLVINDNRELKELNFKHQNIYVSLSEFRAIVYATQNKLGSEVLQRCLDIYNLLKSNDIDFSIPEELNFYRIESIQKKEIKPILLEINTINDENLFQENNYEAAPFLRMLRKVFSSLTEEQKFTNFQYMNFGIKTPINVEIIKAYSIEYSGKIEKRNFKYALIEI
ncbi:hypothetical protein BBI01_03665 [Chryseobacterium artocarpi]|uniref:Uncharacterized protein n=1 Tax=Chryseobacterium artocarpi TaxID=1414727 RepID=A0A1B9A135_9FLAO|nr:hypothetical protein [Chryseobacterium artocarpi]OCA77557.1 hypothetical protein BBI01_03665 [Chryseobacterium artocarpi]